MAPIAFQTDTMDRSAILPVTKGSTGSKTLLLCPPSISSNPAALEQSLAGHSRVDTDIQMMDRLALGLVKLPTNTYTNIILLSNPSSDDTTIEAGILRLVAESMAPGAKWTTQDSKSTVLQSVDKLQVLLSGLIIDESGTSGIMYTKPAYTSSAAVPLKLGRRKLGENGQTAPKSGNQNENVVKTAEITTVPVISSQQHGAVGYKVGFVDLGDDLDADFGEDDDDELIDEDTLLDESDLAAPIQPPPECRPKTGKRRRACKDCTCGLKEKIEEEDALKRSTADAKLASQKPSAVKLGGADLAEIDFTVEGKASSCGNCYLGDAFRCDGCPYIGLPAFKPGETVQIPLGDDQF